MDSLKPSYTTDPNQSFVTSDLSAHKISFMKRKLDPYGRYIEGELCLHDISICAQEFINKDLYPNVRLLIYFCGTPSTVLDVSLHVKGEKVKEFHYDDKMKDDGFKVCVMSEGVKHVIGTIHADLPNKICDCCDKPSTLPVLLVKMTAYQSDGSDKLLGVQYVNVFEAKTSRIELYNVSLSTFMYSAKQLMVPCIIDFSVKVNMSKCNYSPVQYQKLNMLLDEMELIRRSDDIRKDFAPDRYEPRDAGTLVSIVPIDTCILSKSLYYLTVGKYITVTYEWCYMLLDYHLHTYGISFDLVYDKLVSLFGLKEDDSNGELERKLLEGIKTTDEEGRYVWNNLIHIIINALSVFVLTCNKYSLDKEEIVITKKGDDGEVKSLITEQDNERNTTYCLLVERTYDCEDGAGLMVVLFHRVKQMLLGGRREGKDGCMLKVLGIMMNQYEPFISVIMLADMCFEDVEDETFPHMGGILLPKSYMNEVFYHSKDGEMERIRFTKEDREFLSYKLTTPFMMESTASVMSIPFCNYLKSDITDSDYRDFKGFILNTTKPFCQPLSDNIIFNGKHMGDIYRKILSLHPLSVGDDELNKRVGCIYIDYGGDSHLSFRELGTSFMDPSCMRLYYTYEASEEAYKDTLRVMKTVSPYVLLDVDLNRYKSIRDEYVRDAKKGHPFYHKFTHGIANKMDSIPYLPVYMTNNDVDMSKPLICIKTHHDHYVGIIFKSFV